MDEANEVQVPDGWTADADHAWMERDVTTEDFLQAVDLVNLIAREAEGQDHHPDLTIHGYNHLRIRTTTHDEGTLTQKDERLAAAIDRILEKEGLS